ncbi:MAG: HEAT repeat domain-containing protein [Candidatus Omnitrophota bacterium]
MKRTLVLTISAFLCVSLVSRPNIFAQMKEAHLARPQAENKYSRIIVCSKALEALGKIGDPSAQEIINRGLKSKEFLICVSAVGALGRLGDKTAVPELKALLRNENYLIKIMATKVLLKLGEQEMEGQLLDFLNNKEPAVRAAAVEQLGEFKSKYMNRLMKVLCEDDSYLVRLRAIQQLGINRYNPATALIEKALKDPNPYIRQAACIAMGQIGDKNTRRFVLARLNDAEVVVRSGAKEGLSLFKDKELGSGFAGSASNQLTKIFWKDLESDDPGLKVSSFVALASFKDIKILPVLLKEITNPLSQTMVKKGAARALRILKPYISKIFDETLKSKSAAVSSESLELTYRVKGKSLLSLFIAALKNNKDPLHADSVFVLGELKEESSLPELRQALSQDNPEIVANVAYVLGQFQDKEAVSYLIKLCKDYGL